MDKNILEKENIKSQQVSKLVSKKIDLFQDKISSLQNETIKELVHVREQSLSYNDMLDTMQSLQRQIDAFDIKKVIEELNQLDYLKDNPFFARIDLKDKVSKDIRPYYIAKFGYIHDSEPIVIDWRAKLATIYYKYRYPQENVSYNVDNTEYVFDMELKRTYEIDNAQVLKYFNNDLQLSENELIIEKIKDRTGGVLEDIVETIQQDQMEIIESDPREVCVVQGCVGSGKSTVAIHKLSYIFFNYPKIISPEKSILVSKNRVLVDYLSSLFPKLGIFDLKYMTTRDLIFRHLTLEGIKNKFNLAINTDISDFNQDFYLNFNNKINISRENCFDEILQILNKEKYKDLISFKFNSQRPIIENLEDLSREIQETILDIKDEIKEDPNSIIVLKLKETVSRLSGLRSEVTSKKNDILNSHFKIIIKDYNLDGFLGYREALLYLIIFQEYFGFKNNPVFEYCVIDEAQDMSIMELFFLKKMVINNRFCIIGDLNQNIHSNPLSDWSDFNILFENTKVSTFKLETNYRSTKNIVDYANKVLKPFTNTYLPKSIEKVGKDVIELDLNGNVDILVDLILEDYTNLSKSVGIVLYNHPLKNEIISRLKERIPDSEKLIILEEIKKSFYTPRGIYVLDFENCKGLEFNKVYLLGFKFSEINNFDLAKKAFVGVTRAMNELILVN
jgi:DNA helicase-2/ATP-dependent DNA helicase PcrA